MEKEIENLATLIYLAIEVECEACHQRFAGAEGDAGESEPDISRWSKQMAAAAYQVGWREVGGTVTCHKCVSRHAHAA